VVSSLPVFQQKCYVLRQFHPPWVNRPDNKTIWLIVQVMELLIMQSSPASHHFLPLSTLTTFFP
jgi:hypothetical protein